MSPILIEDVGHVRRIVMNRPDKRNALTSSMYTGMAEALQEAATRAAIGAILITGGTACFSAGNDIDDFRTRAKAAGDVSSPGRDFLIALRDCPKPVVAAVAGVAIGIGTTMLLHCDLVYAAESARFALPFVDLGLCPEGGSSFLLPRSAGTLLANELLLLGEGFDAATALRAGLVNAVVPDEALLDTAEEKARILAAKPPAAMRATKQLLRAAESERLSERMEAEFTRFNEALQGEESAEALAAFVEKRPPDFSRFLSDQD